MQSGKLNKRVIVQRLTRVQDDFGQENETWSDVATVWASIEPLQGREQFAAQQVKASMSHRIRMRHIPGVTVTPRDRVYYPAEVRTFEIISPVDVKEKHFELDLTCEEILD